MLVLRFNLYLIVSGKAIHKGKNLATHTLIQNMINKWCGEIVLRTGTIQIVEISTYADFSLLLIHAQVAQFLSTSHDSHLLTISPTLSHLCASWDTQPLLNAKPIR